MTDDRLDELIRAAARDYNSPGAVPRERMWERVQAARAAESRSEDAAGGAARASWRWPLRSWVWTALAAAAVLAIGIGIGRWMERAPSSGGGVDVANGRPVAGVTARASTTVAEGTRQAPAPDDTGSAIAGPRPVERVASAVTRADRDASTRPPRSDAPPSDAAALVYRAEVAEHLAGTEALLTSFRETARSGTAHADPQLASWARDLLTTTRMLQASAPRDDPTMKRLLDDLELVLMQIAEYTAGDRHRAEDAQLIEQAIERHAVITRLRTIPAGLTSPGT